MCTGHVLRTAEREPQTLQGQDHRGPGCPSGQNAVPFPVGTGKLCWHLEEDRGHTERKNALHEDNRNSVEAIINVLPLLIFRT